ncbi:PadR family transcriptional regulator [Leptolyngbya ohadii]|uniref:PadR family transcriptional regulator n=1 Tax=Leptolyngbya ohadii TaxID=1962290 RepID=UPI000B59DF8A|nr:helix-turn-helix transcriptional regulator [Leptolyngbya ohadii]
MSTAHIILGLLQQQERTGYDLKTACFDDCIAHVWQADQALIYRTLDKLESQGWVGCTIEIQHDRPNRKIYRLTESGEAELNRWLCAHQPLPIVREPLLMQLYLATNRSNEEIITLLEEEQIAHQTRMAQWDAVSPNFPLAQEQPATGQNLGDREQVIHQLVLELLRRKEQVYLDWLADAIQQIRACS